MHLAYKVHKLLRMKKELKEVYANQVIETLALFLIGIFIPAYLIDIGFSLTETVVFMLIQWLLYGFTSSMTAKINARIGVKHTILLRSPILIGYLAMVMNIGTLPGLFIPAALLGGISLSLYWTSINIEYVMTSDKRSEGEEAGLLFGLPYVSAVLGPLSGVAILTLFGFQWLFMVSVLLILLSVVPLFLSDDYKAEGFRIKEINLFLSKRRIAYFTAIALIYAVDFLFWSLYVFLNYGFVLLGLAASLMGLGMIIFTLFIGSASNTIRGRRRVTRIGGFLAAGLWLMRLTADSEAEFLLLSLLGGFIITSLLVSIHADFSIFAKKNGPARSVVFRQFWLGFGYSLVIVLTLGLSAAMSLGDFAFIRTTFIIAALASLVLIAFRE